MTVGPYREPDELSVPKKEDFFLQGQERKANFSQGQIRNYEASNSSSKFRHSELNFQILSVCTIELTKKMSAHSGSTCAIEVP